MELPEVPTIPGAPLPPHQLYRWFQKDGVMINFTTPQGNTYFLSEGEDLVFTGREKEPCIRTKKTSALTPLGEWIAAYRRADALNTIKVANSSSHTEFAYEKLLPLSHLIETLDHPGHYFGKHYTLTPEDRELMTWAFETALGYLRSFTQKSVEYTQLVSAIDMFMAQGSLLSFSSPPAWLNEGNEEQETTTQTTTAPYSLTTNPTLRWVYVWSQNCENAQEMWGVSNETIKGRGTSGLATPLKLANEIITQVVTPKAEA